MYQLLNLANFPFLLVLSTYLLVLSTYLLYLTYSQPPPTSYTQQPPIPFTLQTQLRKIAYSPDQSSMMYQDKNMTTRFRTGIVDNVTEFKDTQIIREQMVWDFAYNKEGDKIFASTKFNTWNSLRVVKFGISRGFLVTTETVADVNDTQFYSYQSQIVVSQTRLAVFNSKTIYTIDITDEKNAKIVDKYTVDNKDMEIADAKWHPTLPQVLLISLRDQTNGDQNTTGSLAQYNTTSKETKVISNLSTTNSGFLKNGEILLQSLQWGSINIYSCKDGNITLIDSLSDFSLTDDSIAAQSDVFVAVQLFRVQEKITQVVNVYQMIEDGSKLDRNQPGFFDATLNKDRNFRSDIQPQFKLIFTKNLSSQNGFSGISSDGNELYLYLGNTSAIKGSVSRFRRCVDGTYPQSEQCLNCSPTCKTCYQIPTQCTGCYDQQIFYNGTCTACIARYPGCLTCNMQRCLKCNETANFNSTPSNGNCACMQGFFPVNEGKHCLLCTEILVGCKICSNPKNCTKCDTDRKFVSDGEGKCKCAENFTFVGNRCLQCSKIVGCTDCADAEHCKGCNQSANFQLNQDGKCQCASGFWLNQQSCSLCQTKIFDCVGCSQDGEICQDCLNPDRKPNLDNTACICQTYKYEDQQKACQPCDPYKKCLTCTNSTTCLSCDQSANFSTTPVNGQCKCLESFFQQNNTCHLCEKAIGYCVACGPGKSGVVCFQCKETFVYDEGEGLCECPEGWAEVEGKCEEKGKGWVIVVVIIGGVVLIGAIVGTVIMCKRCKGNKRFSIKHEDRIFKDGGFIAQEIEDQIPDVQRARIALLADSQISENTLQSAK